MVQIVLAPCSPFSVTGELMKQSASLARQYGVHLHTHLAETQDEEAFCLEKFGYRPVGYMQEVDWVGPDVWFAHSVHVGNRGSRGFRQHRLRCGALSQSPICGWPRALPRCGNTCQPASKWAWGGRIGQQRWLAPAG